MSVALIRSILETELQDGLLAHDGCQVDLFFDTVDVRRAILGMWDYVAHVGEEELQFDLREFELEAALVDALLAAGWLGTFRMLPPHQAEFLRHLEHNDHFRNARRFAELPQDQFFAAAGVSRERRTAGERPRNLSSFNDNELAALVRRHAADAPKFFKTVQCVYLPWWKRLAEWRKDGRFDVSTAPVNIVKIAGGSLFVEACNAFRNARSPHIHVDVPVRYNDFADATALLMLVELAERFGSESGSGRRVPRFFDSTGGFKRVAEQIGVAERLTVEAHGFRTPVLVSSGYLVHKASFRAADGSKVESSADLSEVVSILSAKTNEEIEKFLEIRRGPKALMKVLDELQHYAFLENVWLPMRAEDDVRGVVARMRATDEEQTQEFEEALESIVSLTKRELRQSTSDYQIIQANWNRLDTAMRTLHRSHPMVVGREDVFRYFRLTRFSLSDDVKEDVERLVRILNEGNEDIHRRREWHELMRLYLSAVKGNTPRDVEVVASILWCLNEPRAITALLEKYVGGTQRLSIDLLYAAACFNRKDARNASQELDKGERVLRSLMRKLDDKGVEQSPNVLVDLCVGIAYLHFHLWEARNQGWSWRDPVDPPRDIARASKHLQDAISFASRACELIQPPTLDDADEVRAKRLYAQNQLLYYLLEQGDRGLKERIKVAAVPLLAAPQNDASWMYTFDDTLARYYHYVAVWTDDPGVWAGSLEHAKRRVQLAKGGGGPEDGAETKFDTHLLTQGYDFEARTTLRRSVPAPAGDS